MPCCLDDLSNSLILQVRSGRSGRYLVLLVLLVLMLTSYGGRLRDRAVRLMTLRWRIEQDKVLLMWRQIQMLKL